MQTLILEGIATSGKSTIIDMLEGTLSKNMVVRVIPEAESIMVIVDNKSKEVSLAHLKTLLPKAYQELCDVVIFDRFYLTHIFRTDSTLQDYKEIEDSLKSYSPITIYLKVNEALIAGRIEKASKHRDAEWNAYISTKGQTFLEIAEYYVGQQRNQLYLLAGSSLPYKIYDTSDHNYEAIVADILGMTSQASSNI